MFFLASLPSVHSKSYKWKREARVNLFLFSTGKYIIELDISCFDIWIFVSISETSLMFCHSTFCYHVSGHAVWYSVSTQYQNTQPCPLHIVIWGRKYGGKKLNWIRIEARRNWRCHIHWLELLHKSKSMGSPRRIILDIKDILQG